MRPEPVVVLAATPRGWAADLRAHAADHGGVVIRATVLTQEDALAERCDVVLVDDVTSFLSPTFVAGLRAQGRAVLGLYDPGDTQGKGDLVDAGVDVLVPADVDGAELVAQIGRLAASRPADRSPPLPDRPASRTGRVVGVAGPPGGVGVTEIAIELAARLGTSGVATALVDADELAPSHAQRLGLPLHPNLRTALYAVEHSKPLSRCLQPLPTRHPLVALTGMPVSDDWAAIPPAAPTKLLSAVAADHGAVVVDLGHCLPRADGVAGLRFGHALALAGRCPDLVVVSAPTPIAVTRTIDMVAQLQPLARRIHLVVNRVGADRYVRDEAVAELRRATRARSIHLVAEDPRVGRAAWQGGRVGRGRFTADVAALVDELGWA